MDAFINLSEFVYNSLNLKHHSMGIFIDLKKAFDTVNHGVLLGKLERYGVRGLALSWLASYFKDRKQMVAIAGKTSAPKTTNISIPQGSIVGPTLFLIYINDLPQVSDLFSVILYADDTTLITNNAHYNTLIQNINHELPKLHDWLNANRLSLNLDKTYSLLFTNRHECIDEYLAVSFHNNPIDLNQEIFLV